MTLGIGDAAPDFTLRDQHGRRRSLGGLRGERAAVLVFFPFAFSGVCSGELRDLREQARRIDGAGGETFAISCDPMFAMRRFAEEERFGFPLLSDFWPHGEVAAAYGVLDPAHGCPTRSTFVVDPEGIVRWRVHNPMGVARDGDEYAREVRALGTPSGAAG